MHHNDPHNNLRGFEKWHKKRFQEARFSFPRDFLRGGNECIMNYKVLECNVLEECWYIHVS